MLNAALNLTTFETSNVTGATTALMTYLGIVVEMEHELVLTYPEVLALLDARLGRPPAAGTSAAR